MTSLLLTLKIAFAEVAGFFVLLPACALHEWTEPTYPSSKPLDVVVEGVGRIRSREKVDEWSWNWLNAWYANIEDGVSGQQAYVYDDSGHLVPYASTFHKSIPKWVIAYCWSAWRNGANNIKRPLRNGQ